MVDVMDLRAERQRALASRTVLGALRNALGYVLCAYCLFKCAPICIRAHEHCNHSMHAARQI